MLRLGTTVMGVNDLGRALAFWSTALGYRPKREVDDDDDFMILVPQDGGETGWLAFDVTTTEAPEVPHVHVDLYVDGADRQAVEIERLIGLGATRVDWPHYPADPDYVVLADPDGNRFCVVDTEHEPAGG